MRTLNLSLVSFSIAFRKLAIDVFSGFGCSHSFRGKGDAMFMTLCFVEVLCIIVLV
jgi:hypothetical protein